MKLRDQMNNNSALATVLAVVVLIVSLGVIYYQARPRTFKVKIIDVYYFDLGTGKLFLGKSDLIPPIDAPSGPGPNGVQQGVRAYVFSCTDCKDESSRFIGWFERYTPEAQAAIKNPPKPSTDANAPPTDFMDAWEKGHQIAKFKENLDKLKWVMSNGDAGMQIMQDLEKKCPDGSARACFPNE